MCFGWYLLLGDDSCKMEEVLFRIKKEGFVIYFSSDKNDSKYLKKK